ncbi:hypothetical protein GCM10009104_13290 [Marinobacterium maritimum]|uniref:TRAP transporter small permease protein n=2 Tax=Marinobacterium maritimum TaxID=500162 RepID=A0ABP3T7J0_9GAMM
MLCVMGIGIVITLSILMRTFAVSGIPDEVVIIGDLMVGALTLPLAFVAASRGFICVELFTQALGLRWQLFLNVFTALIGIVAVVPITYAGYLAMVDAFESGSYFFGLLNWPKWPGYTVFFTGYCLFFIRLIDLAIYDSLALLGIIKNPCITLNEGGEV